jgi:hypothetical protein
VPGCHPTCTAPDLANLLHAASSKMLQFAATATRASCTVFTGLLFMMVLSGLPCSIVHTGLYLLLASALLGLPLPALLAGCLLHGLVSSLPPLLALLLLLGCLHRLHVRRLPLVDPATWQLRFTGLQRHWTQHQQ